MVQMLIFKMVVNKLYLNDISMSPLRVNYLFKLYKKNKL